MLVEECAKSDPAKAVAFAQEMAQTNTKTWQPILEKQGAFLLDFDYARTPKLTFDQLEAYIDESHHETKRFFETIITDESRKYMNGEVVE
jgi:uncharacterized protein (TIGR04255 family)